MSKAYSVDQYHAFLFTLQHISIVGSNRSAMWHTIFNQLTPAQQTAQHMLSYGFIDAFAEDRPIDHIPQQLHHLQRQAAFAMYERYLNRLARIGSTHPEYIRSNLTVWWRIVRLLRPYQQLELPIIRAAHALLQQPEQWYAAMLTQLQFMWETHLQQLWPSMSQQLACAELSAAPERSIAEHLQSITTAPLPDSIADVVQAAPHVHLIQGLSMAHPYMILVSDSGCWLAVHTPQQAARRQRMSPVTRGEIVARLHALADQRRLQILELLAQQQELSAQQIIAHLNVPQSSTSRMLNQLRATGFVTEQRRGSTDKYYRLVADQLNATFIALEQLLAGALPEASVDQAAPEHVPVALQRYVNHEGTLIQWPAKYSDRQVALEYLTTFFEAARRYTESEVNTILRQHPATDHANLRRYLCDLGLLARESDGSAYWKVAPAV